jgi:hypothetical protein
VRERKRTKFLIWAIVWTIEKNTMAHATCSTLSIYLSIPAFMSERKTEGGWLTVKIDVPIEWDDRVQRRSSEERDEVPAYREQDEDNVDYHQIYRCPTYYEGLGPKLLQSLHISLYYGNGMAIPNDQPNVPLALLRLSFILY